MKKTWYYKNIYLSEDSFSTAIMCKRLHFGRNVRYMSCPFRHTTSDTDTNSQEASSPEIRTGFGSPPPPPRHSKTRAGYVAGVISQGRREGG